MEVGRWKGTGCLKGKSGRDSEGRHVGEGGKNLL